MAMTDGRLVLASSLTEQAKVELIRIWPNLNLGEIETSLFLYQHAGEGGRYYRPHAVQRKLQRAKLDRIMAAAQLIQHEIRFNDVFTYYLGRFIQARRDAGSTEPFQKLATQFEKNLKEQLALLSDPFDEFQPASNKGGRPLSARAIFIDEIVCIAIRAGLAIEKANRGAIIRIVAVVLEVAGERGSAAHKDIAKEVVRSIDRLRDHRRSRVEDRQADDTNHNGTKLRI